MNQIKWTALVFLALATTQVQAQGYQPWPGNGGLGGAPARPGGFPWDNPGMSGLGGLHQPLDPFPHGGPPPGPQVPGLPGVPRFDPQAPIRPPQRALPGLFPNERKKDDDSNHGPLVIPPIRFTPPAMPPSETISPELRSVIATSAAHSTYHPPSGLRAAGEGSGKWFGGIFAGIGAVIAGVFRSIFGSGSKESDAPGRSAP
jgi:hypothetical protein